MAGNYRRKRNPKKTLWTLIIVGVALILIGLVAFLITNAGQKKTEKKVTEAVKSYLSAELGSDMVSVDVARSAGYGLYSIQVAQKNVKDLADKSYDGDEAATADWAKITEAYSRYATELQKKVGEMESGFGTMLYLSDADVEDSMLLWFYNGQLLMNAGVKAEEEATE